jgi:hypothetical protein
MPKPLYPILFAIMAAGGEPLYVDAAMFRIHPITLGRILNGVIEPTEPQRQRIAAALGRPADELFTRREDMAERAAPVYLTRSTTPETDIHQ